MTKRIKTIHDMRIKTADGKILSDQQFMNMCIEYNNFLGGEIKLDKNCYEKAMILAKMSLELNECPNFYRMGFHLKFE